jgi:hypothetical protein
MLADLDESLRTLLKRELGRHGFDGVEVAFDAPASDWSAGLSGPTVNAFLYDLSESTKDRPVEWGVEQSEGSLRERRPPMMVEAAFAITAWARAVEDEHRLLSQVLAVLYAYPTLPNDVLAGSLRDQASTHRELVTSVGRPRSEGRSDFWSALGGKYKASLDYAVTLACEPGVSLQRGPEVRTQTVRVHDTHGARGNVVELQRVGGRVLAPDDTPVAGAWVAIPELGLWAASRADGRFTFDHLRPGSYGCVARAADGTESAAELVVPGTGADIRLGGGAVTRGRGRK